MKNKRLIDNLLLPTAKVLLKINLTSFKEYAIV